MFDGTKIFYSRMKPVSMTVLSPRWAFAGLSLAKQNSKPPKLKYETLLNQWSLCQVLECQALLHKRKTPYWRLSGDGSVALWHLFHLIWWASFTSSVSKSIQLLNWISPSCITAEAVHECIEALRSDTNLLSRLEGLWLKRELLYKSYWKNNIEARCLKYLEKWTEFLISGFQRGIRFKKGASSDIPLLPTGFTDRINHIEEDKQKEHERNITMRNERPNVIVHKRHNYSRNWHSITEGQYDETLVQLMNVW